MRPDAAKSLQAAKMHSPHFCPLLFTLSAHAKSADAVKVFGRELRVVEDPECRPLPLQTGSLGVRGWKVTFTGFVTTYPCLE